MLRFAAWLIALVPAAGLAISRFAKVVRPRFAAETRRALVVARGEGTMEAAQLSSCDEDTMEANDVAHSLKALSFAERAERAFAAERVEDLMMELGEQMEEAQLREERAEEERLTGEIAALQLEYGALVGGQGSLFVDAVARTAARSGAP